MLWGLGWTFSSGADVAWLTDELDDPLRIDRVLTLTFRYAQYGAIAGMVTFGVLGWITSLGVAIVVAGVAMVSLGALVRVGFTEHHFTPTREHRLRESVSMFRRGVVLARGDQEIMLVLTATVLVSSGAEAFDRLYPKRLIDLGFPESPDPIVWFATLGVALLTLGAVVLRIVESRIDGDGAFRRILLVGCLVGSFGLIVLAHAAERHRRNRWDDARRRDRLGGHPVREHHLGQSPYDVGRARHRAVVPRSDRIGRRDLRRVGPWGACAGDLDQRSR